LNHVSAHSFTPALHGKVRTADVGPLYGTTRAPARSAPGREVEGGAPHAAPALRVRRNYPFAGTDDGFMPYLRARFRPHAYLAIEIEMNQAVVIGARPCGAALRTDGPHRLIGKVMQIRVGCELIYECPQPTPMILMLNIHYTRAPEIVRPDHLVTVPPLPISAYRDSFGNWCSRIVAPPGVTRISTDALINDSGLPDVVAPDAKQTPVESLPEETLIFLLGSRYCDTERLLPIAWQRFGNAPTGWGRVQAICDFVHDHIQFGYQHARSTKTAWEAYEEGTGVCRDYAHLAIAFCRCMNIPARYCTGYLGDIGIAPPYGPMDFAGWFDAWLDGHWYTFDARNNVPRIGRVLMARGRDAADVALSTTFGPNTLLSFKVWTDEVVAAS